MTIKITLEEILDSSYSLYRRFKRTIYLNLLRVIGARQRKAYCQDPDCSCKSCIEAYIEERKALNELLKTLDEVLSYELKTTKDLAGIEVISIEEKDHGVGIDPSYLPQSGESGGDSSTWKTDWKSDLEEALTSYGKTLYPFSAESQMIEQLKDINERLKEVSYKLSDIERKNE